MAAHFAAEGSPLYAELAQRCADEPLVAELGAEPTFFLPLKLFAGVHYLTLAGELSAFPGEWQRFREVLHARREWLARWVKEQPVQTHEVQRSWGLLPGFLTAVRQLRWSGPVDLVELGPSGGLNLLWDGYRYRYGDLAWGPADAPLVLDGELRAAPPPALFELAPSVRRRIGVDLEPVDLGSDEGRRVLEAFVWADQPERVERLRRALRVVGRLGVPALVRGDYVELLPGLLSGRDPEALTIVFHSASAAYLGREAYARLEASLAQAGADGRPLAWVRLETPREEAGSRSSHALDVRTWPGGRAERLARVAYHAQWLEWVA